MYTTISLLFQTTRQTVYNWKREQRPIITLITKYFTKDELEEFLNTGHIARLESQSQSLKIDKQTFSSGAAFLDKSYKKNQAFSNNEFSTCTQFTKALFLQLCDLYEDNQKDLQNLLIDIIQKKENNGE